jgi:SIR2-like domain
LDFGDVDDLRARLDATLSTESHARPIAVLAGSGLTVGAIPSVSEIVNVIRKRIPSNDAAELDKRLAERSDPGLKYQEAFKFLSLRRPPEFRDKIIRLCTLRAYAKKPATDADLRPELLMQYEADIDSWDLPHGIAALGRIWSGMPSRVRGPIITTNFDPLIEIAIRKAGGTVSARIMDTDGTFLQDVRAFDFQQVVHMHGYWRESSTLSMTTQLTLERPALNGSIRALLGQYTLLVIGYGAWRDALTLQLMEVIREQSASELDILWCFHGNDSELHDALEHDDVLSNLRLAPGNVQFYTKVDANQVLPLLETTLSPYLQFPYTTRYSSGRGALLGWSSIAGTALEQGGAADDGEAALSFFDGRLPNWQDAVSKVIPKRDVVNTIRNQLGIELRRRVSSLTLIVGASGEGKTTALMQVAAAIALEHPEVVVLYNGEGRLTSVGEVMTLPSSSSYLLVMDDAFRSIERLRDLATRINKDSHKGIHLLLASRDTDWSDVGGFTFGWNRQLPTHIHRLRGISRLDATAIVASWESLGTRALGALSRIEGTSERIETLVQAAADDVGSDGAFLGALLATRYGPGLSEHIRELLIRLSQRQIHFLYGDSDYTLLDAFYLVALPHAAGVRSLSTKVLARALDITEQEAFGSVIFPLGDEAAISYNTENVLVRHHLIARTACDLANDLGGDYLRRATERVVRAAISVIEQTGMTPSLHDLAYLSQHLEEPALSIVAAEAAVAASPHRLSYRASLSRAYRLAGRHEDAIRVGRESLPLILTADDALTGARPTFTEWGVAEGNKGRWACNAVLAGVALQDSYNLGNLQVSQAGVAVSCLALAFRRLWESRREFVYLSGLASVAEFGHYLSVVTQQRRWLAEAEEIAFRDGAATFSDLNQVARALGEACRAAVGIIDEPFPTGMPVLRLQFEELVKLAEGTTRHRLGK